MADVTRTLDASGLACPMPVVRTRQAMDELAPGDVLEVISTDRGSLRDLPAWAEATGNRLIEKREEDGRFTFLIEKG
jgi:tRNA 2-thiouridine synthesizing protein A